MRALVLAFALLCAASPVLAQLTLTGAGVGTAATTFDPANKAAHGTLSGGNLVWTYASGASQEGILGTNPKSSGSYYFEDVITVVGLGAEVGVTTGGLCLECDFAFSGQALVYQQDGNIVFNSGVQATGATYTTGDNIGVCATMGGSVKFYKNNALQATVTVPVGTPTYIAVQVKSSGGSSTLKTGAALTYPAQAVSCGASW